MRPSCTANGPFDRIAYRKTVESLAISAKKWTPEQTPIVKPERRSETLNMTVEQLKREKVKCEKLASSTSGLTERLEKDLEAKLKVLNVEVERIRKLGGCVLL